MHSLMSSFLHTRMFIHSFVASFIQSWPDLVTTVDIPEKRNVICCGIGKLSQCDKIAADIQTINDMCVAAEADGGAEAAGSPTVHL